MRQDHLGARLPAEAVMPHGPDDADDLSRPPIEQQAPTDRIFTSSFE